MDEHQTGTELQRKKQIGLKFADNEREFYESI